MALVWNYRKRCPFKKPSARSKMIWLLFSCDCSSFICSAWLPATLNTLDVRFKVWENLRWDSFASHENRRTDHQVAQSDSWRWSNWAKTRNQLSGLCILCDWFGRPGGSPTRSWEALLACSVQLSYICQVTLWCVEGNWNSYESLSVLTAVQSKS